MTGQGCLWRCSAHHVVAINMSESKQLLCEILRYHLSAHILQVLQHMCRIQDPLIHLQDKESDSLGLQLLS